MTTDLAFDNDYATFVLRVRRLVGVDLAGYKPEQMRRRLLALAQRHGQESLAGFAATMAREPAALSAFKNFFTINVSEFLRDPPRWIALMSDVLPQLLRGAGSRPLKIWSAGCSYGAEPYTLALLLAEQTPAPPFTMLATDIDETILRAPAAAPAIWSTICATWTSAAAPRPSRARRTAASRCCRRSAHVCISSATICCARRRTAAST